MERSALTEHSEVDLSLPASMLLMDKNVCILFYAHVRGFCRGFCYARVPAIQGVTRRHLVVELQSSILLDNVRPLLPVPPPSSGLLTLVTTAASAAATATTPTAATTASAAAEVALAHFQHVKILSGRFT